MWLEFGKNSGMAVNYLKNEKALSGRTKAQRGAYFAGLL